MLVAELKPVPGSPGGEHQEYAQQADYLGVGVDLVAQLADCLAEGPGQQAAAISRVVITAMPCWAARDRNARRMRSWVSALPTGQAPAPAAGATTISVAATGRTASAAAPGPLGCREPGRSRTWPVRPPGGGAVQHRQDRARCWISTTTAETSAASRCSPG